ncbi:MAG TPA: hypothetical protein VFN61_11725 [Acidimicrobiales bacterium]|nr:hypothetical protein [Acidimicrobiales bacterium]
MAEPEPSTASSPAGEQSADEYLEDDEYIEDDELLDGEPVETVDEQGRRHIRMAAPAGTDEIRESEAPRRTGLPDRAERWRATSAVGGVMTAFALGLQQAFEPDRNQPAIIMETSGDPPTDLPVEATLAQLGPRQSSVTVRPWLIGRKPVPGAPVAPQTEQLPDGSPDNSEAGS